MTAVRNKKKEYLSVEGVQAEGPKQVMQYVELALDAREIPT